MSYLVGGVVADGLPVRRVITVSLVMTGVAGLFHLLPLNFYGLLVIYAVWGISTTFAFQPACIKAVRVMAGRGGQGKAYGYFQGVQSAGAAIVAMVALSIFNWGAHQGGDEVVAMRSAIVFYSVVNIAMGIVAYFVVRDDDSKLRAGRVSFKGFAHVATSPSVWLICLIVFCNHIFCLGINYCIPYVTDVLAASVAFGAMLGVCRKWSGVVGNIGGGYIADRIGSAKLMMIAFAAMLVGMVVMLLVPAVPASAAIITLIFVVVFLMFQMNMAVSWTMLSDGGIPVEYSGTAAGLICTAGALPETFVTLMAGNIIDSNPGPTGFHYFFIILVGVVAVALTLVAVWQKHLRKGGANTVADEEVVADRQRLSCHTGVSVTGEEEREVSMKSAMFCRNKLNVIDDEPDNTCGGGCPTDAHESERRG